MKQSQKQYTRIDQSQGDLIFDKKAKSSINYNLVFVHLIIFICVSISSFIHKETLTRLQQKEKVLNQTIQKLNTTASQLEKTEGLLAQNILKLDTTESELKEANNYVYKQRQTIKKIMQDIDSGKFNRFCFVVDAYIRYFSSHFSINRNRLSKISEEQRMFYSLDNIPPTGTHFIKVEIVSTRYGMISIGVMPQQKKQYQCVYCDVQDTYYLYCANGNIYNGKTLGYHHSRYSKINKVRSGDTVTMLVNRNLQQVTWYVNDDYAASQYNYKFSGSIVPFIAMASKGDEIQIIRY